MLRLFLSSFSIVILGVACAFLSHLVLAKLLSAEEYGVFSFIASLSLLISVFALFGFQNSVVRLINQPGTGVKSLIRFARKFTILGGLLGGGLIFAVLHFSGIAPQYPIESLIIGAILTPLMVSARLHAAFLRGFEKSNLSVLYETTLREILLLAFIACAFLISSEFENAFHALFLLTLALSVSAGFSWFHTHKHMQDYSASHDTLPTPKEWLHVSFPMMLTIFAQRFMRRSDIIILGLMVQPALVGAYAIAAQFSDVSSIGQKGIFSIFSPRAASLYAEKKHSDIKPLYKKMQVYGLLSAGALSVIIAFATPSVMAFFGEGYNAGYSALLILLVGQFITVCYGPVGILMIMTEHEKVAMKFTMIAALGNLIFNPLAIYFYGLEGAAIVTSFFLMFRGFLSYLFVKKEDLI